MLTPKQDLLRALLAWDFRAANSDVTLAALTYRTEQLCGRAAIKELPADPKYRCQRLIEIVSDWPKVGPSAGR